MTFNIIDVSNVCCRKSIASGDQNVMICVGPALADRRPLFSFAAGGVGSAAISVCFSTEAVTERPSVVGFRSCPADPFGAAGRARWARCGFMGGGFMGCFLTCSPVLANAFVVERLALFFGLVRPAPDRVRVREFFRSAELIISSYTEIGRAHV